MSGLQAKRAKSVTKSLNGSLSREDSKAGALLQQTKFRLLAKPLQLHQLRQQTKFAKQARAMSGLQAKRASVKHPLTGVLPAKTAKREPLLQQTKFKG